MRIHHLDCASMCPPGRLLVNGTGSLFERGCLCCHCLLLETAQGLVLVDTGLGTGDLAQPLRRLGPAFMALTAPRLDPAETAIARVRALGHQPEDVRHIVLTHLDPDHAGGMTDFPHAQVHVFEGELEAALAPTPRERMRYHPEQWGDAPAWVRHRVAGDTWLGFEAIQSIAGLEGELALIPLTGHTRGHCGVAVRSGEGWLLHAGDAYFHHDEVSHAERRCPPGLELFQTIMQVDGPARLRNQARLRELRREQAGNVTIFCSHDPHELAGLQTP